MFQRIGDMAIASEYLYTKALQRSSYMEEQTAVVAERS